MTDTDDVEAILLVRDDTTLRLVVRSDLDVGIAHQPYELVSAYLEGHDGVSSVVVDLTAVSFVDSTGLGGLIRLQQEARRHDLGVILRGVGQRLRRLMEMTGLDNEFSFDGDPAGPR